MSADALVEMIATRGGHECDRVCAMKAHWRAFRAFEDTTFDVQDAPRAAARSNDLLAMTRLASPNRMNSCAWFFARPL